MSAQNDTHLPMAAEYVLYAGCGISVASILFTLIVYTANRYLRVKRQHMITINLCISLLIFYIGFILSVYADFSGQHRNEDHDEEYNTTTATDVTSQPVCIAGTSLLLLGWFYVHSWILTHWIFLCLTIQQIAPRHISNFFIKVSLCTYVPASVPAIIILIVDRYSNETTNSIHCFLDLNKAVGRVFAAVSAVIFVAVVICTVLCTTKLTCMRNPNAVASTLKKNRVHLVRLIILSIIIIFSHIPHLVLWLRRPSSDPHYDVGLEIFDGIVVGLHGILIVFCLLYRGNRFCEYWSHVVSGKNPNQSASLRLSRLNVSSHRSKRGVSSNTTDFTADDASTLDRKVEPREGNVMELTIDDEVFLSSKTSKENDVNRNNEMIKYPSVRIESSSSTDSRKSDKLNIGSRARLNSFRRKVLRGSFRKSNKSSVGSMTNSPPHSPNMRKTSTLNRISIRDSRISLAGDPDRKTSF